jgi:MoaA/NifB/PqqE/SkfB family radical SAM enzyme
VWEVHFEVATFCSLKCIHCSTEASSEGREHSSLPNLLRFLKFLGKFHDSRVWITGGEPLAFPGLSDVIRRIAAEESVAGVGTFTSGCLPQADGVLGALSEQGAKELRGGGLLWCYVSVYSADKSSHEKVTLVPGSHDLTTRTISNLIKARVNVRVNCPILWANWDQLEETAAFCRELGAEEIRFLRLVSHGRARDNWEKIGVTGGDQREAITTALDKLKASGPLINVSVAGFPEYWECRPFGIGAKCQAGVRLFYVNTRGEVYPCACKKQDARYVLGNLDDQDTFERLTRVDVEYRTRCLQDE